VEDSFLYHHIRFVCGAIEIFIVMDELFLAFTDRHNMIRNAANKIAITCVFAAISEFFKISVLFI